jgi:hypothetical protein
MAKKPQPFTYSGSDAKGTVFGQNIDKPCKVHGKDATIVGSKFIMKELYYHVKFNDAGSAFYPEKEVKIID